MFSRSHLEQSTSSFETVFLLGSDICAETETFYASATMLRFANALIIIIIVRCRGSSSCWFLCSDTSAADVSSNEAVY